MILQKRVPGSNEESLNRFLSRAKREVGIRQRVDVLVTSSAGMRSLNRRFRAVDKPTDVLSFPSPDNVASAGEIAISAEIAAQNAARLGHSAVAEIKVLVLHGLLHLAGMDHERDNGAMAQKEAHLRGLLRLPSILTERAESAGKHYKAHSSRTNKPATNRGKA